MLHRNFQTVSATHKPTGLQVTVNKFRSKTKSGSLAVKLLKAKLCSLGINDSYVDIVLDGLETNYDSDDRD